MTLSAVRMPATVPRTGIQPSARRGQTISYAYATMDRLVSKTYPNSTSVSYAYDNIYQLTGVTAPNPESYTYDPLSNWLPKMCRATAITARMNSQPQDRQLTPMMTMATR